MSYERAWRRCRRMCSAAFDAGILGGVVAAPVGAAVTIVGLTLPTSAPLHHFAAMIFGIAVLWFLMALLAAHPRMHRDQEDRAAH
jgi:hypothetical protein